MTKNLPQKIYFDESGFTGNNLLHPHQPLFSYGSVSSDDDEAKEFVEDIIRIYRVQNGELKGGKLIKYNQGRNAILDIINHFDGRMKVVLANKKFALAGKMFEYLFEPCISEQNSLFYQINFHKFIANYLYVELEAKGIGAEEIFIEFEKMMREKDLTGIETLFSSSALPETSETLIQIREFVLSQLEHVSSELNGLPGDGLGKWILDLTDTMLFTLLLCWGETHQEITAICDQSKPLNDNKDFFNTMIGRQDKLYTTMGDNTFPLTVNLSGPIELVDSKTVHGVQIADTIAAAFVYACGQTDDKLAKKCREVIPAVATHGNLIPESEFIDLNLFEAKRNTILLQEIHSRAISNQPLLEGMADYITGISRFIALEEQKSKNALFL